tara:strand:+ start:2073 stop:2387 length:315 start_codon:yes stop_codon:yes gene_type:complete
MQVTITNQNRVIINYEVKGYLQDLAGGGYELHYQNLEPMFVFDREDAIDFIQGNIHQLDTHQLDTESLSERCNDFLFEYEYNHRNIISKVMKGSNNAKRIRSNN